MTEEELFEAARHMRDAADRAAYLDHACAADPALRRRVEALLRSHSEGGSFLKQPALEEGATGDAVSGRWVDPADLPRPAEGPGSRIGPYKLLQQLGEGGMGVVFLAEQEQPVKRRVALKIIKAGMDSARVVARFEAERQALALMDHPNIAKVFDAGATDGGRPFFVMELVKGIAITKFCDQEQLTPKERLELFVPVCSAVQHAHQKGVIHRDLKPSNVLIALYDGKPVPKVIDFGVAKATAQTLTERKVFTEVGQIVGTLEYMAPEQAELNNLDIDTRADIYSLGVLLYELLTGSPPFTAQQLRSAAFTEMLRLIREVEPPRPSTRLSSSEQLPGIAAKRKLEPARLARLVRGDLDWIVMKCLEKERGRRYETANGLALDVQRYLSDEPVLASPPGVRYRLRKFVRKHRGPVLAAVAILALLVAGIAGTSLGFVRAERQRQIAEGNEEAALKEKAKAQTAQKQAMEALRATTDDVVEQLIGARQALGPAERAFLENTLKRWQTFAAEQGDDQLARLVRAEGVFKVAYLRSHLGQHDAAIAGFREAIALCEQLAAEFPEEPEYREHLADSYLNLGGLHYSLGKLADAEAAYRQTLTIEDRLAAECPAVPQYRQRLAKSHNYLGILLRHLGKRDGAGAAYRQALAIQKQLAAEYPADPEPSQGRAMSLNNLANLLGDLGRFTVQEDAYREALAIHEKLAAQYPLVPGHRMDVARTSSNLGLVLDTMGKRTKAEAAHRQAVNIQGKLVAQFPAVPEYRQELGRCLGNLGSLLRAVGKLADAEAMHRQALTNRERLFDEFPTVRKYREDLATSYRNLGQVLHDQHRLPEAEAAHRRALAIQDKLAADIPGVPQYREDLAACHDSLGYALRVQGKAAQAEFALRQALSLREKLATDIPEVPHYRQMWVCSHNNLGNLFSDLGKRPEAEAARRQALDIYEKLATDFPNNPQFAVELANGEYNFGNLLLVDRRPEKALEWYARAIATCESVLRRVKVDTAAQGLLCWAYWGRAEALDALKRHEEAAAAWDKALDLSSELLRPEVLMGRAVTWARLGKVDAAIKVAEAPPKNVSPETLYNAARVFALAAGRGNEPGRPPKAGPSLSQEECAKRAIAMLRQAASRGLRDTERMRKDDDLKALREHEDFTKLLAELEKKSP
jgi:serine/threonine protein kinase/tetratricopeptide (TPR) repeat protein